MCGLRVCLFATISSVTFIQQYLHSLYLFKNPRLLYSQYEKYFLAPQVRIIKGLDNRGWTVLDLHHHQLCSKIALLRTKVLAPWQFSMGERTNVYSWSCTYMKDGIASLLYDHSF